MGTDIPDELPFPTTAGRGGAGPPLRLRLREPGELVAAVPHLLGFVPTDSLVLAAVHDDDGRPRLGAVVRVDLPPPEHAAQAVGACVRRMGRREPSDVALVVIGGAGDQAGDRAGGPGGPDDDPPRTELVDMVEGFFDLARIPVRTRLWVPEIVAGAPWRCYPPCDCRGTLPDPHGSEAAVATTMLGQVTYRSRGELEELVTPDPGAAGPRRRRLLEEAASAAVLDRELGGPAAARRDLRAVESAAREVASGGVLVDEEVARLAVALTDPRVRDVCFGWALGESGPGAAAAERLWTLLVRAVPAPEVAEPATLLACAVLVRGGGALVGAALDRARAADPDHTLSRLVVGLLDTGIGQAEVLDWVRGASTEAAALLGAA